MMKLSKEAMAYKQILVGNYGDNPLVDVLADSVARYDEMQQIVNKEGCYVDSKVHPLMNQLRSVGQTITAAVKVLGPSKETEKILNKVTTMKKPTIERR